MKAARLEPGNILTGVFFLLSFFLYRRIHHRIKDMPFMRSLPAAQNALILSLLFSLMYMLVDGHHYIEQLTSRLYQGIILLSVFAGFTILFYELLLFLYSYSCNREMLHYYLFENDHTGQSIFFRSCTAEKPVFAASSFVCSAGFPIFFISIQVS